MARRQLLFQTRDPTELFTISEPRHTSISELYFDQKGQVAEIQGSYSVLSGRKLLSKKCIIYIVILVCS